MKIILVILFSLSTSFCVAQISLFYKTHVSGLQKSLDNVERKPELTIQDDANGFYSYDLNSMGITGFEEMAYFIAKNGKKFVVISSFGCGPMCSSGIPSFHELKNNMLVNQTDSYLPENIKNQIDALWIAKEKDFNTESVTYTHWVKLPKKGTTIQLGLMEEGEPNGKFVILAELVFNSDNGTFSLVKK